MPRELLPVEGAHKALSVRLNKPLWRNILRHLRKETKQRGYQYRISHFINDLLNNFFKK